MTEALILDLPTEADTTALGQRLARASQAGDVFLLSGPIGAGKSHLARAFIRERLGAAEDVPSPTFTLVQVYGEGADEIWHADLYRLTHPDEVWELGLDDAFTRAICLVEWPTDWARTNRQARCTCGSTRRARDGARIWRAGGPR